MPKQLKEIEAFPEMPDFHKSLRQLHVVASIGEVGSSFGKKKTICAGEFTMCQWICEIDPITYNWKVWSKSLRVMCDVKGKKRLNS